MSKAAFGELFNIAPNTFRNWINERNKMPVEKAMEICDYFKITLDQFYRAELTESILKQNDAYYIKQVQEQKASETIEQYRAGAKNPLEAMIEAKIKEALAPYLPKDDASKAS